ncbi:MAG: right-handed parallel beta-helix repeat-containing protein [Saccharofermentanales bacterium]
MIVTWNPPESTIRSNEFSVYVKRPEEEAYTPVFCQRIFTGHQKGEFSPSSLSVFDFDGEADIRIVFHGSPVLDCDVRPHSYDIRPVLSASENSVSFRLQQNEEAPRKMLVRINDGWEEGALHLLTNPTEKSRPDRGAPNVLVIGSGDEIPEILPEGKDTYYFDDGLHTLPQGLWAELDLGGAMEIDRFEILQDYFSLSDCATNGRKQDPLKFTLEYKTGVDGPYSMLFDGTANKEAGRIAGKFSPCSCRTVRLKLYGTTAEKGWIFAAAVSGLKLFAAGSEIDAAQGKAVRGAIPQFRNLTDGDPTTLYTGSHRTASWHAGESFFIARPGTCIYLSAGAVVLGSFASEDISDISITGRGILDSSHLHHENPDPGEARTGAIWLTGGDNYRIEGITILDAPMWQVVLNYSSNILVKNINLLGYVVNADGIHLSGCRNAVVEGCFVRTCDDLIVIYHYGATSGITVRNCVFLNDGAHVFLYGLGETKGAYIRDMRIEDCDIISQQEAPWEPYRFSGIFKFWAHGGNVIENIAVERIHIDSFRYPSWGCIFQLRTEKRFEGENPGRAVRNIRFKDIFIESGGESPSLISGISEDSPVENISFENYCRAGVKAKDLSGVFADLKGSTRNIIVL